MAAKKKSKRKVKASPKRSAFKAIGVSLLIIGICASFYFVSVVSQLVVEAYGFDITKYKLDIASTVYAQDEDGQWTEYEQLYSDQRRIWISIDDIPQYIPNAAIAIEDERFESHHGVDMKRTLGATLGFMTGNAKYGGSTITQQLIKNITDDWDDTWQRKLKEILRALVLETQMSKREILEYYLNFVYFGNGCNGIEMAAQTYFDKSAADLTLAEAASIIGITNAPTYYDPYNNPQNNKKRQETILDKMLELGYIDQVTHDEAVAEEIVFTETEAKYLGVNSYFTEMMAKEIAHDLAEKEKITIESATDMVYTGGLTIYSTVDVKVQKSMEKWFASGDQRLFPTLSGDEQPQAAMVVISAEDGSLAGVVGGVGEKNASFVLNRAADRVRQPGSSIKPLSAYGPAVELGVLKPASIILDEPFEYNGWKPKNWYKGYKGNVTMREAVVQSMNIPAIKTVQQISTETSYDFLKNKFMLDTLVEDDKNLAPLALGGLTDGVSVLDMTAAYGVYANGGIYTEPYTYTKVLDKNGNVLLEKEVKKHRVVSEKTAHTMTNVLISSAEGSLGISARLPNMQSAGKTGTTNGIINGRSVDVDRWYMGYTPYYVGGVWYGYDYPKEVPYGATRVTSHKIWQAVMTDAHEGMAYKKFDTSLYVAEPEVIPQETVDVCKISGLLAIDGCPVEKVPVPKDQENSGEENVTIPTESCAGGHTIEEIESANSPELEEPDESEGTDVSGENAGEAPDVPGIGETTGQEGTGDENTGNSTGTDGESSGGGETSDQGTINSGAPVIE